MFKILIVEDEPPILRSIKKIIEKLDLNTQVFAATNGKLALDIISSERIDLLITDIKMPLLSGLELIQILRKQENNLPCIIITSFTDMDYIKQAFKTNVIDYVVKPVDPVEFSRLVLHIHGDFLQKSRKNTATILKDLLENSAQKESYCPEFEEYANLSIIMYMQNNYPHFYSEDERTVTYPEENVLKQQFAASETAFFYVHGKYRGELYLFFFHNHSKPSFDAIHTYIRANCSNVLHSNTVTIQVTDYNKIPDIIKKMREQLQKLVGWRISYDVDYLVPPKTSSFSFIQDFNLSSFAFSAYEHNMTSIHTALTAILDICEQNDAPRTVLQPLLESIFCTLYTFWFPEKIPAIPFILDHVLNHSRDYEDIRAQIQPLLSFSYNDNHLDKESQLVALIKTYIDTCFHSNISLSDLSRKFSFDATYLSKIFKKKFQMTPMQYIQDKRISEAQRLILNNNRLSIYQISKMVGYDDSLYFSKLFKKKTGLSPKEFKNNCNG